MKRTLIRLGAARPPAILVLFAIVVWGAFTAPFAAAQQTPKLKVYISVDMEGITGVVHGEQVSSGTSEYAAARKWMAEDVNAAIEGALAAGAREIIVNDSHGSMRNIDPADLHPRAVLISGSPKPLVMMEGIDASFNACLFIGYHARAGTADATLDHTISGAVVRAIRVNGIEMPELGLNAAIAGMFGVPVVLVSGDVAVCQQAKEILGSDVVTVPVKDSIGRQAARLVPMSEARKTIKDRTAKALRELIKHKPYRLTSPYKFELDYHTSAQADYGVMFPGIERPGARTVAFTSDDYLKGFRTLRALIAIVR
ncbi:MAG: M55 family metallopeptidase [Candidatus Aminicenantes bacterium]